MATDTVSIAITAENRASAAIQQARKDLDALAQQAKAAPLIPRVKVDVNTQDAKARIQDLEREIQNFRTRAATGSISVGDVSKLREAQSELRGLKSALDDITGVGTGAGRGGGIGDLLGGLGLGGLTKFAGIAGLGLLAKDAIGATVQLGQLGETVKQQRAYFEVWSGGVANATANLNAMRRAVGAAMTDSEAMAGANRLLSMGLASNASELEKLSRMAVMLGGSTRTASESIEEFSLLLANQSILRLDTFGISGAKVRARIEELQAATAGLSREQAFLQAVMEEGTRKVDALAAAGVSATTKTQDMAAATRQLKETLGGLVAQPYTVVVEFITKGVKALDFAVSPEGATERDYGKASEAYQQAVQKRIYLEQALQDVLLQSQPLLKAKWESELETAKAVEAAALAEYKFAQAAQDAALNGDMATGASAALGSVASGVTSDLDGMSGALIRSSDWLKEFKASADGAADAAYRMRAATAILDSGWGSPANMSAYALAMRPDTQKAAADKYAKDQQDAETKLAKERDRLYTSSAKTAASAYESAMKQAAGRIQGYLSQGMNASISLKDVRNDAFKPGNNGPFENLFRALDIAVNGTEKSPWDEVLGLDQATAKKISEDFQRGIFSPEVMGLIDVDALVNEAKLAELAEKTQAAFAQQIATKAGVSTNLVSNLFGYGSTGAGAQAGAVAQQQVTDAMQQVAGSIGDTVNGKDFAGRMIGYGKTIWGSIGAGMVEEAKASTKLQEAIDAMVAAALTRQGGATTSGGAKGAARSQGVTTS